MCEKEIKLFDLSATTGHFRQLTDLDFWWHRLRAKAFIENDISKQLTESIKKTKEDIKLIRSSPQSYVDPNLLQSLELVMMEDQRRADIAKNNASAYRSLTSELEKAINQAHLEAVANRQSDYKLQLKEYEKIIETYEETEKRFKMMQMKYNKISKRLNKLKKTVNSQQDPQRKRELEDKIITGQARRDVVLYEYKSRLAGETILRQKLIKKSDDVLEAWKSEEENKLRFLVRKWESCVCEITRDDISQSCIDAMKVVKNISITDMLNNMAEKKLKPRQFVNHPPLESTISECPTEPERDVVFETPVHNVDSDGDTEDTNMHPVRHVLVKKQLPWLSATLPLPVDSEDKEVDDIEEIECKDTTPLARNVNWGKLIPRKLFGEEMIPESKISELKNDEQPLDVTKMRNIRVMVIKEYKKQNNREISLHVGTKIKQLLPVNKEGFSFGSKRTSTKQKKKGFYPASCVAFY